MKPQTIKDIVDKLFADIEVSDKEKNTLIGGYMIGYYKELLAMLLIFKGTDKKFLDNLNEMIDAAIAELPDDQKKQLDEMMDDQKAFLLNKLIESLEERLSPEHKKQFTKNVEKVLA